MNDYRFGNYLYTLRSAKGLSQSQLAEQLGVSNKAVSKWETGAAYPSTRLMYPLAKTLGVSVEELYRAVSSDGQKKSPIRRYLDKLFYSNLVIWLPVGIAVGSFLLFLIFGDMPDKAELAVLTPIASAIMLGTGFLFVQMFRKNPMCSDRFLDLFELITAGVFFLGSLILCLQFLLNFREGYSFTFPAGLLCVAGVALGHRKRL